MHILVDMDGVLANWGKQYDHDLDNFIWPGHIKTGGFGAEGIPRTQNQKAFDLHAGMDLRQSYIIRKVMDRAGFYADLEPFPNAVEAMHWLVKQGHDVSIVTSPWLSNPTCVQDKYDWVSRHLGKDWVDRVIITKDKTLVDGDILIDDRPDITGKATPKWKQVLFRQPYNKHISNPWAALLDWGFYPYDLALLITKRDKELLPDGAEVDVVVDNSALKFKATMGEIRQGDKIRTALRADLDQATKLNNAVSSGALTQAEADAAKIKLPSGEVRTTSSTGGEKGAKPQDYSLIPVEPLNLLAELYHNGATKYSSHNWRKGYPWSLSYSAAMRHMTSFWNGEDNDPEMKLPHVISAAFHMFALAQYMIDHPEFDDRYKKPEEEEDEDDEEE